jgi:hypothetical protein
LSLQACPGDVCNWMPLLKRK